MTAQQAGLSPSTPNTVSVLRNAHPQVTARKRFVGLKTA